MRSMRTANLKGVTEWHDSAPLFLKVWTFLYFTCLDGWCAVLGIDGYLKNVKQKKRSVDLFEFFDLRPSFWLESRTECDSCGKTTSTFEVMRYCNSFRMSNKNISETAFPEVYTPGVRKYCQLSTDTNKSWSRDRKRSRLTRRPAAWY